MIATPEEIQSLKIYFQAVDLPDQIKLNAATTLHDPSRFIKQVLANLEQPDISETAHRPRYEDLCNIRSILQSMPAT